jgi:hypothetical protein
MAAEYDAANISFADAFVEIIMYIRDPERQCWTYV